MGRHASISLPRGRPRAFDPEAAVERAMTAFWSRGYHGTSLPDLLRATKLSRGSLYAAFGDKHALFLRALDRYISDALARVDQELDARTSALSGLRTFLAGYVDRASGDSGRRGCLFVATTMELATHDPDVAERVRAFFQALEGRLASALSRAKDAGEIANGIDPSDAARLLVCVVEGLRVVGKIGPPHPATKAAIDTLITQFAA